MSHEHPDHDPDDVSSFYSQETWDARYAESSRVWSGNPNPLLVEHAADLAPGTALDVGCGEGADAVWLATQGWRVTALDVSEVALARTAQHARESGVEDRVEGVHVDLIDGEAIPGRFDLVSMQFLHPPQAMFDALHQRVGEAVAPGGRLLVVGHHPDDLETGVRRPHGPALLFTPEQVVAALGTDDWQILVADAPSRQHSGPDGPVTVRDSVVVAVRCS
ncbi:MAG: class I SAM-dependent methyltransferase [Nocardioides sp.]